MVTASYSATSFWSHYPPRDIFPIIWKGNCVPKVVLRHVHCIHWFIGSSCWGWDAERIIPATHTTVARVQSRSRAVIFFLTLLSSNQPCILLGFDGWLLRSFLSAERITLSRKCGMRCSHFLHSFVLFVGAFEKLRNATISFVMFVRPLGPPPCPYGTAGLPMDGFSLTFS